MRTPLIVVRSVAPFAHGGVQAAEARDCGAARDVVDVAWKVVGQGLGDDVEGSLETG